MQLPEVITRVVSLFEPRPRYKVSDWADAYAQIPQGNAEAGDFRCSRLPYQRDMHDDAIDPTVVEFLFVMGRQLGKTQVLINQIGYFVDYQPSGILFVKPTIDTAKAFSKDDLGPFIEATPRLRSKVAAVRSRDSGNTMRTKRFPGGSLAIVGANSPASLRQHRKRVVLQDEIDAYQPNQEGDPISQADGRAESFHNAVKGKATTPTLKGIARSEAIWNASDKQYWHVDCPRCGGEQILQWSQVKWTWANPDGTERSDSAAAVYVCGCCKAELSDSERITMILGGRWKPTAPFNGIRGRHLSGLYRILGKKTAYRSYLHEFVEEFLKAKRSGPQALMVWVNTFLAEWYELQTERIESSDLAKRREDYGHTTAPKGVLVITAGIDTQDDRLEVTVLGWGEGDECWALCHRVIPGNTLKPQVWAELLAFLDAFQAVDPTGRRLRINSAAIDAGGHRSTEVYRFAKALFSRRIFAVKGLTTRGQPVVAKMTRNNRVRCPVYLIGTDTAKRQIYGRLNIREAGPGRIHFTRDPAAGFDDGYFSQLVSEEIRIRTVKGFKIYEWFLPEGRRNEALDCFVYATAAKEILSPNYVKIARRAETTLEKKPPSSDKSSGDSGDTPPAVTPDPGPEPAKKPFVRARRGGWVRGWRK